MKLSIRLLSILLLTITLNVIASAQSSSPSPTSWETPYPMAEETSGPIESSVSSDDPNSSQGSSSQSSDSSQSEPSININQPYLNGISSITEPCIQNSIVSVGNLCIVDVGNVIVTGNFTPFTTINGWKDDKFVEVIIRVYRELPDGRQIHILSSGTSVDGPNGKYTASFYLRRENMPEGELDRYKMYAEVRAFPLIYSYTPSYIRTIATSADAEILILMSKY